MKILFVHNYYQHAGGEDNVVAAEMKLLASRMCRRQEAHRSRFTDTIPEEEKNSMPLRNL